MTQQDARDSPARTFLRPGDQFPPTVAIPTHPPIRSRHFQRAALVSPEAWIGVGAFWSGGSMSPVGQPSMEPARNLCGTAIAGSVLLASVRGDGSRQPVRLQSFLASARDIAANGPGRIPSESPPGEST